MREIDRSVPIPIYFQLKSLILRKIEQNEYRPGDRLPTEAEFCERYNISRTPVRQALLELVQEGMLSRIPGRGTFVLAQNGGVTSLRITVPDARWRWPLEEATRVWNLAHADRQIALDFDEVPLDQLHDQLSLAVGQGQAPDISVLDSVWVAEFAHRRYLHPLASLDPDWHGEVRERLYPSLLAANSFEGELYAMPTNADATVLWYRRDWFREEGLEPPGTWVEMLEVARHFSKEKVRERHRVGPHPLIFSGGRAGGETTTYQLLPFIWSAGGDLVSDDKVNLDSAETRGAVEFLRRLIHVEHIATLDVLDQPWDGTPRAFAHGEVAMAFGGTYENFLIQSAAGWDVDTFLDRAGFVPIPAGPQGRPATLIGSMAYGIYRQSVHSAEALELLKLALAPSILKPFSLETGQTPALVPVAESLRPEEDGFLGRTGALFAQARGRPSLPLYDRVSVQFQEMIEQSLAGREATDAAIRRAAERISGITGLPLA